MWKRIKIAITGSGGYVGCNLLRSLRAGEVPFKFVTVSREEIGLMRGIQDDAPEGIKTASKRYAKLFSKMEDVDVMVHLAGAGRQSPKSTFYDSILEHTEHARRLCLAAGVQGMIYFSGLGVSKKAPIAYLIAKDAAESVIRNSGLEYVILRPSYIVGRGDHLSRHLDQNRAAGSKPVDIYKCDSPIQPIYIDDAIKVIDWATREILHRRQDTRITLDLVGPDKIPFYEYVEMIAGARRVKINPITLEQAYAEALRNPESAPFGVDDLGLVTGGFTGSHTKLENKTGLDFESVYFHTL